MSEAYIECLKELPFGEGFSDELNDNPVLRGIKKLQAEVKRLADENDAMKLDLDSAIWPFMENGKLECSLIPPSCRAKDKGSDE